MSNSGEYIAIEDNYVYNDISNINRFVAYKNPFRYRSYYYDFETGLYYLNSRYYDPQTGRFINADDINYLDQNAINGLNLYAYCVNNPINLSDESGHAWWDWLWKGLLGIVMVVAIATTIALTAGVAALALGASFSTAIGITSGVAVGGLVTGGMSLFGQAVTVGLDNLNFGTLAIDTFNGVIYGGITGGVSAIGSIGAKLIGGGLKVALSGLTTVLHDINRGLSASKIFSDVGIGIFMSTITQFAIIGGGFLYNFLKPMSGNGNIFTQFIKNIITVFNNSPELKISITKVFAGIWYIFNGKYN